MSSSEAVCYLNDLADNVIHNTYWGQELKECIRKACLDKGICPQCGNKLKARIRHEWSEAWGQKVSEDFTYKYCLVCGWDSEKEE